MRWASDSDRLLTTKKENVAVKLTVPPGPKVNKYFLNHETLIKTRTPV